MFDNVISFLFTVTDSCVIAKASVHPYISDDAVMHVLIKGAYFSLQYIYTWWTLLCCMSCAKTSLSLFWCTRLELRMPMLWRRSDGRKSKCVQFWEEHYFLVGQVEASRVDRCCCMSKGGLTGAWILSFLSWLSHAAIDLLYCPPVDMLWWRSRVKVWTWKSELQLGNFLRSLTQP